MMMLACMRKASILRPFMNYGINGACRSVSTDTGKSKVYEFRKYSLKPSGMGSFMKLFEEFYPLRVKHSKLFGYWNVEMGGINQLVHIWEYDSFAQRQAVRAALAQDKEWMEGFIAKAFQYMDKQENCILLGAEWCDLYRDKTASGVFELATYGMKLGGPKIWEDKLKSSVLAHAKHGHADLIGVWYTDIGDHNQVEVLWRYDSFDGRREGRNRAHGDRLVVNKVRDNLQNVLSHSSILMTPLPFLAKNS